MIQSIVIIFFAIIAIIPDCGIASVKSNDNKEASLLNQRGANIDPGTKILLNQFLRDNKALDDSYYSLTFTCKHSNLKKMDSCIVSELNYKKQEL